nr:MAG TPA: hypothetical protein [Bacteriophage sp.]
MKTDGALLFLPSAPRRGLFYCLKKADPSALARSSLDTAMRVRVLGSAI